LHQLTPRKFNGPNVLEQLIHGSRFLACMLCTFVTLLATSRATAQSNAELEALLKEGVAEYAAGNWGEAHLLFSKVHAAAPTARTFRGLGLCDYELRHYAAAVGEFEASLADQRRPLTPQLRQQVEHALERARQFVARYHLQLPDGVDQLIVDGAQRPLPADRILLLDPGAHVVSVRTAQGEELAQDLSADVGVQAELVFASKPRHPGLAADAARQPEITAPAPASPPSAAGRTRVLSWVALGLTGAFGAGIVVAGLGAQAKHDAYVTQQRNYEAAIMAGEPGTPPDEHLKSTGQTLQLLTNISIVACAVSAAATVVLFVVEGRGATSEQPSGQAALTLGVSPLGIQASGAF
jgi:hypothetical protein